MQVGMSWALRSEAILVLHGYLMCIIARVLDLGVSLKSPQSKAVFVPLGRCAAAIGDTSAIDIIT